jgi:hypothetical protein
VGVFAGPDLSESGLVLALDAGNNKSHSTNRFVSYGSGNVTETVYPPIRGTNNLTRVATGTVVGGYTVKTTDVVYSYALGGNGCHYQGHDVPIPGGVYGTFSFDYLVTGATNYPSTNYLANFENVGNSFSASGSAPNSLQDVWQRVSFTGGPSSANGAVRTLLYPGGCGGRLADSGTIYFRNPRVEWTNVDTGTENFSSMSNITTWYDLNNRTNNGTLTNTPYFFIGNTSTGSNGYFKFDGTDDWFSTSLSSIGDANTSFTWGGFVKVNASTTSNFFLFGNYTENSTTPFFAIAFNNSGTNTFIYIRGSGGQELLGTSKSLSLNTWYYIIGVRDAPANQVKLYVNGVLECTDGFTGSYSVKSSTNNFGGLRHLTNYLNANISSVVVYNRALTAAEIQQNFNATRGRFGI